MVGSKFFTSAAMWTLRSGHSLRSNDVIGPAPLRQASAASQASLTQLPTGETTPIPVITTRRMTGSSTTIPTFKYTGRERLAVALRKGVWAPSEGPAGGESTAGRGG